ncbi:pyridoxamine 5'-phosphate oxidase family protein [Nocardia pseudobrasiliensis]|nr:pyridoxamine 5'-phosphate oxidase family protein [Nocardia pseudobrasiliensis]
MATWKQFEAEAGELAAQVRARFEAHESHVLATLRKDGSPRVSGSEVQFDDGELTFGSMLAAVKARDLHRDPRCALHAHPTDGDAKVAGSAIEFPHPTGEAHAFRLDLTDAVLTTVDQSEQLLVIQHWQPGRGVRTTRRR